MDVGVTSNSAARIELRGAGPVGIAAARNRTLFCYLANFGHSFPMLAQVWFTFKSSDITQNWLAWQASQAIIIDIQFMLVLLSIIILIFSIILHELAHGFMADKLGDPTARLEGRLTLNPIKHIDPIGSIVVPLITSLGGFTFGWAKPVPYNPYNLKNKRSGELLIAIAGPLSNLAIALILGTIIRFAARGFLSTAFLEVCVYVVVINIVLAIFNLIPLPPLDGSKLLFAALPRQYGRLRFVLEAYAPVWILLVVFFLWKLLWPIIPFVFYLFTGMPL